MKTKLELISKHSRENKEIKFTTLAYLINESTLKESFNELNKNKAPGIDGITFDEYSSDVDFNIKKLVHNMKSGKYYPKPVKRVYIKKTNGKKRPLGIPTIEDKMVQGVMADILNAIYEPIFLDCSFGFRPNRNCHMALKKLDNSIYSKPVKFVIDADIEGFFDNVNQSKLKEMLNYNINDKNFNKLLTRFLKSGIVENGKYYKNDLGVPQGGVISPILANVYLHFILDLWFEKAVKPKMKGYVELIRYADDFLILAENKNEVYNILKALKERLLKFDLTLSNEKTKVVEFDRENNNTTKGPRTFNFLGFTHYGTKTKQGKFRIGRKTESKRMSKKLKEMKLWLKKVKNLVELKEIWKSLCRRINGYYQYYAVSDNFKSIQNFYHILTRLIYRWINKRSQKRSMTWDEFNTYLKRYPLPKPRIIHNFY